MRIRLRRQLLLRSLLRPEPLLALLVALLSLVYYWQARQERQPRFTPIEIAGVADQDLPSVDVRLVSFDAQGLEVPSFVSLELPVSTSQRLQLILEALREETLGEVWPEPLPTPNVFVENVARRQVAVLDFRPEARLSLTVSQESRLLDSVEETLLANGVDEVRYLLHGEAAGVFLEHLAVPTGL